MSESRSSPEGYARVSQALNEGGHPHPPRWLEAAARTSQEAAGALGRADAEFVKSRTGFSIGGVAPLAHTTPVLTLIDRELFRYTEIWAAAGHPNGVFRLSPDDLVRLTGAPVADVVAA